MIDVAERRAAFPALDTPLIYFDGPGGTQTPCSVIGAVSQAMRTAMSNTGWRYEASRRSSQVVDEARQAIADLFQATPDRVIFGPSTSALVFILAEAISATWLTGDNIVLSELDHEANISPWLLAAQRVGVEVRWARVDPHVGALPVEQYDVLIDQRTRLVAVCAASNVIGTRPDIGVIASRLRATSDGRLFVDAVHAAPHTPLSLTQMGADFVACSTYKFFGPHLGAVVAAPGALETLKPSKVRPQTDRSPMCFERGTLPFEALAGVSAAVDHIASLAPGSGDRSRQLRRALEETEVYTAELLDRLLAGLESQPRVTCYGAAKSRTPTMCFTVEGLPVSDVAERLGDAGICVSSGTFYAPVLMDVLGVGSGAVRVGLLHYNTRAEVDTFLDRLTTIIHEA